MMATLANAAWLAGCLPEHLRFRRALGRVRAEQEQVLQAILRRNETSEFGVEHEFAAIRTVADYQRGVPLREYEDYRPRVERIAEGRAAQALTCEPVRLFEPTSGSIGASKWIPYTGSLLREFQRGIHAWIGDLFLHDPDLMRGSAYWAVSPAQPSATVTPSGIPVAFADDTEYVGGLQQRLVRSIMAVPSAVRHVEDIESFWYATLRHLVRRSDLRFISVWNPSFLTLLMERLTEHRDRLARDEPARRDALNAHTPQERHARLWPRLRMISCWTDGNSATPAAALEPLFPQARIQGKGLIATEGFVSLPWESSDGAVLAVRSHFLEFLPADPSGAADATRPQLAHELEPGQLYSVVLTTGGGLYRYHIGDLVTVTRRERDCPVVRFVSRRRTVDWCGEKLHEVHVARVLAEACARQGVAHRFAMLACDRSGAAPRYVLYVEAAASDEQLRDIVAFTERGLCENFHYQYARRLGQLGPMGLFAVRHANAAYLAACVERGQRVGAIKPAALDAGDDWTARFEGRFVEPPVLAGSAV
jgi:GH3 auxin-responsive promoter